MANGAEVELATASYGSALKYAASLMHQATNFETKEMYKRVLRLLANGAYNRGESF